MSRHKAQYRRNFMSYLITKKSKKQHHDYSYHRTTDGLRPYWFSWSLWQFICSGPTRTPRNYHCRCQWILDDLFWLIGSLKITTPILLLIWKTASLKNYLSSKIPKKNDSSDFWINPIPGYLNNDSLVLILLAKTTRLDLSNLSTCKDERFFGKPHVWYNIISKVWAFFGHFWS